MTLPIILLLLILVIALVLFSFEWIPPDVTALGILVALIVTGLVPIDQAFDGFGSDTVMLLLGLLIMTAALMRNGVVEVVGRLLLQFTSKHPGSLIAGKHAGGGASERFYQQYRSRSFLFTSHPGNQPAFKDKCFQIIDAHGICCDSFQFCHIGQHLDQYCGQWIDDTV